MNKIERVIPVSSYGQSPSTVNIERPSQLPVISFIPQPPKPATLVRVIQPESYESRTIVNKQSGYRRRR